MVHDTPARRKARELRAEARDLEQEASILAGIRETEELGAIKANRANELKKAAKALNQSARLEDITVRQNPITRQTKKGDRIYYRWLCSWQEGDRTVTKYLFNFYSSLPASFSRVVSLPTGFVLYSYMTSGCRI